MVSVDGTDFEIAEPGKFTREYSRQWYSHKFKGAGVRYEVGLCIKTGDIVWVSGPYECGTWSDLRIFRDGLLHYLDENERVEADKGYGGDDPEFTRTPGGFTRQEGKLVRQAEVRSRHEHVNKRFKQWGVLKKRFRHDLGNHSSVFRAVSVITQLAFSLGEPLTSVEYDDDIDNISL